MTKQRKYIPQNHINPIVLGKKIAKLEKDLENHKNLLLSVNKANDMHVEHLSNFVRHDLKNAMSALSGIIYNASKEGLLDDKVKAEFETVQQLFSSTIDNFAKLIPSTKNTCTTLPEILNAVEMLSRGDLQLHGIEYIFDYDRNSSVNISYSFQSLVQVLHNLTINAINAVKTKDIKKIYVLGHIQGNECLISVYDNGENIKKDVIKSIFNYGFSTTGGSGVGLFHAKSIMEELGGKVEVLPSDIDEYNKSFTIRFNLINEKYDETSCFDS